MTKKVTATDAKNNFGGLLDEVATSGRVDIVKHGRLVAVILAPHVLDAAVGDSEAADRQWGRNHMIAAQSARSARMVKQPSTFDED
jgi:prevent-host-death family protein